MIPVFPHQLLHLAAGPTSPFRVIEGIITDQGRFGPSVPGPAGDEAVPVFHLGVPLQAKAAVHHVFDVVGKPVIENRAQIAVAMNHGRVDPHFLQALKKQGDSGGILVGTVAHPHDCAVIVPRAELVSGLRKGLAEESANQEDQQLWKSAGLFREAVHGSLIFDRASQVNRLVWGWMVFCRKATWGRRRNWEAELRIRSDLVADVTDWQCPVTIL